MIKLKFRAWDSGVMYQMAMVGEPANPSVWTESNWRECTEGAIIMQFTGFKDKYLKDIYVGDILKRSRESKPSFVALIDFVKGRFVGITCPYRNHQIPIRNLHVCDYDGGGYDEIIGNIFENTDLVGQYNLV